ncbi:unnamed protein product [Lupinus luteus]|uniref:Uncharacterized protein n=1 Tax=Lupinus luteus TaxID=3873 RepID=A0AAV1YF58_LUPLU
MFQRRNMQMFFLGLVLKSPILLLKYNYGVSSYDIGDRFIHFGIATQDELMRRPLRLKFSERKVKEAGSKQDDDDTQLEDGPINGQREDDPDDTQPKDDADAQPEDNTCDNQLVES